MSIDLYHEVRGRGPVVVLISGGNGDAGFYEPFAHALAGNFTVITYDRRGFSRSPLAGAVDENRRLETDVDDARALLRSMGDGPGYAPFRHSRVLADGPADAENPAQHGLRFPTRNPPVSALSTGYRRATASFDTARARGRAAVIRVLSTPRHR
jgi:pimeloyl-ACP methyl ester carboxylesterase